MAIRFVCECGKKLKASEDKIGKKILCSGCGEPIRIPEESTVGREKLSVGTPESSPTPAPKPKSKPKRAPEPGTPTEPTGAAAAASANLDASGESADSIARRLMKEHEAEVRKADGKKPKKPKAAKPALEFDLAGAGKQIAPYALGVVIACIALYWLSSKVMSTKRDLPELVEVSGIVTNDKNEPLPYATITFHPLQDAGSLRKDELVSSSVGQSDAQGKYEVHYAAGAPGVVPNMPYAVTFQANDEMGRNRVEATYRGVQTTPEKVNLEAGRSDLNFTVKTIY